VSGLCYGNLSAAIDVDTLVGPADWLNDAASRPSSPPARQWLTTISFDLVTALGVKANSDATTRFVDPATGKLMKCAMILPVKIAAYYQRQGRCIYARWRGTAKSPAAVP
jgi:hypothetical protein